VWDDILPESEPQGIVAGPHWVVRGEC
jgi:hypothetical protein